MGLIVSSIFHNFATMQNELTTILNAKKELIPKYKMVTLMN